MSPSDGNSLRLSALEPGVELSDLIALFDDFQSRLRQATQQVVRVIHLAVSIRDAGEVERGLLQAERRRLVWLTIPKQFQDV